MRRSKSVERGCAPRYARRHQSLDKTKEKGENVPHKGDTLNPHYMTVYRARVCNAIAKQKVVWRTMRVKNAFHLLVFSLVWTCLAHEPVDPDERPAYVLDIDGAKTLTLACGLTVPKIKDARGYPHGGIGLRRSHPCDDDRCNVLDLWRADQFVAAWRDPGTNVVTLLRLSYPFPYYLRPGQTLPANTYFRDAHMLATAGYSSITSAHVQDWLNFYYRNGAANEGPFQAVSVSAWMEMIAECDRYKVEVDRKPCLVYVFKIKEMKTASRPLDTWFALEIRSERECIDEQEEFAKKFLCAINVDPDAVVAESDYWRKEPFDTFARANAVRGVRNLGGEWEIYQCGNFCLITDNESAMACAEEGLVSQQKAYDLFHSLLFPFGPASLEDVCVIRVYATGWEFEDSMPCTRKWAGGLYLPGSDEVLMRGWSRGGTVHEIMHRYLCIACGKQGLSTWFNEGFACYLAGCEVSDGRLVAQPVSDDSLLFGMVEKGELNIVEKVFTTEDFYHDKKMAKTPKDKVAALAIAKNYAASWGIIYFLREAPPSYPKKGYEKLIPLYWETLQQTGNPVQANRAILANLKMSDFLIDYRSYFLTFAGDEETRKKRQRRPLRACGIEHDEFVPRERRFDFAALLFGTGASEQTGSVDDDRTEAGASVNLEMPRTARHSTGMASSSRALARDKRGRDKAVEGKSGEAGTKNKSGTGIFVVLTFGLALVGGWFWLRGGKLFALAVALAAGGASGAIIETNGYAVAYRVVGNAVVIGDGIACAVEPKPDREFKIPSNLEGWPVVAISAYAFAECEELTVLTLPKDVAIIGEYAFYGCRNLKTVTLPDSVTDIGAGAFFLCSSLQSIALPPQVKVVPAWAFGRCFRLSELTFGNAVGSIGDEAFLGCAALTEVVVPNSVTMIGDRAFKWCFRLKKVMLKGEVTVIGCELFAGCSTLSELSLPPTVTVISDGAFMWCSSLENLLIPGGVTRLGSSAFYGCRRLSSLNIPDVAVEIGRGASPFH